MALFLSNPAFVPLLTVLTAGWDGQHEVEVVAPNDRSGFQVVLSHSSSFDSNCVVHEHSPLTDSLLTISAATTTEEADHLIAFSKSGLADRSQCPQVRGGAALPSEIPIASISTLALSPRPFSGAGFAPVSHDLVGQSSSLEVARHIVLRI